MSEHWITAVRESGRFSHYEWNRSVTVPITTLDSLLQRYGIPEFCKIDVEGFEHEILSGLSVALPFVSFEYHIEFLPSAFHCIQRLENLRKYEFNYTQGNRMRWELQDWVTGETLMKVLRSLPFTTLQGDVYARIVEYPANRSYN
jgi:hypothetical protein